MVLTEKKEYVINPQKIRIARAIKGWNLVELERRSGVRRKTISEFEKGIRKQIRMSTFKKLINAFDMDVNFFVTDEDILNLSAVSD